MAISDQVAISPGTGFIYGPFISTLDGKVPTGWEGAVFDVERRDTANAIYALWTLLQISRWGKVVVILEDYGVASKSLFPPVLGPIKNSIDNCAKC